jgi:outer membrane lipoprotein-sorting protein
MKRSLIALAALLVLVTPATAQEPTVEEILEGHYEAIGGLDAWEGVSTAKMVGTMSAPQGFEAPFTMMFKRPDKSRLEFTFQGMTGVQAVDGDVAWQIMPFMGKTEAEEMPADQAKLMKEQADFDGPLVNWEEDGNTIEYVGSEDMEGTQTHKLKVTLANGDVRHYYLDADYFLPIKVEAKTMIQGQEQEIEVIYGDYKEVGGLMMAHSIENKAKGQPAGQVITIQTAEVNIDLPDEQFAMPTAGE